MAKYKQKTKTGKIRARRLPPGAKPCPTKGLDAAALQYAELLVNPCDGPLVSGPFGDSQGGYLTRFEIDYVVANGINDTAGVIAFSPGNSLVTAAYTPSDGAGGVLGLIGAPANTFLANNASQFRCVAACAQLYWPGTELNRGGIVGSGQMASASTLSGLTVSAGGMRTALQHVDRMPEDHIEIVWRPNDYDLNWNNVTTLDATGKRTSLVFSFSGFPNLTGVRIRLVGVYEWLPQPADGMVTPLRDTNTSNNSFTDVLNYVDSTGSWMYRNATAMSHALSSAWAGGQATRRLITGGAKMAAMLM